MIKLKREGTVAPFWIKADNIHQVYEGEHGGASLWCIGYGDHEIDNVVESVEEVLALIKEQS